MLIPLLSSPETQLSDESRRLLNISSWVPELSTMNSSSRSTVTPAILSPRADVWWSSSRCCNVMNSVSPRTVAWIQCKRLAFHVVPWNPYCERRGLEKSPMEHERLGRLKKTIRKTLIMMVAMMVKMMLRTCARKGDVVVRERERERVRPGWKSEDRWISCSSKIPLSRRVYFIISGPLWLEWVCSVTSHLNDPWCFSSPNHDHPNDVQQHLLAS